MKSLDQQSSFFWMIISAAVVFLSSKLPFGGFVSPGAGFLPFLIGILMFLLSLILFVQSLLKGDKEVKVLWAKGGTGRVLLILLSLVFYGLFLDMLGFILMTFLLMSFLFLAVGRQRKILVIPLALFSALGCYVVFQVWLNVLLPKGIFGF